LDNFRGLGVGLCHRHILLLRVHLVLHGHLGDRILDFAAGIAAGVEVGTLA
jgi:hypothetical protein